MLIPSLDQSLHFRASFRLSLKDDPIVSWNDLTRQVRAWIGARVAESRTDTGFGARWFFVGGEWRPRRSNRVHVRTDRLIGVGTEELPEFWACRYEHPCSDVAARQWRTDIGLTVLQEKDLLFSLSTIHWLPPGFIGQPENPIPTAPNIVAAILNSSKWTPLAGGERLGMVPLLVRDGDGTNFLERLLRDDRTCPIVYIAKDYFEGKYLVNPFSLAKVLAGTTSVYMAESSWADKELEALLPQGFRCWNGMVRVYQPNVELTKISDSRRHRYFRREEIESIGHLAVEELLVRGIVRRSLAPRFAGVTSIEDIGQKRNERHIQQLRRNAEAQKDASAWSQLLEQDNDRLARELKLKDEEVSFWQATAEQIEPLEDELGRLRYEIQRTLDRAQHSESVAAALSAKAAVVQNLDRLPNSVLDVVSLIEKLYPDRIFFSEKARRSAEDASLGNFNVAWECLKAMATNLHDLHFQEKLQLREIANRFRNQTGFELAVGESETTKSNKKLAAQRKDTYKGETVDISTHVKHGSSSGNILRVHYHAHPTERRLIIGHCGDHLDTVKTN